MAESNVHQSSEAERLCARCVAIHITEGQVPATCAVCEPPRAFTPERTIFDYD